MTIQSDAVTVHTDQWVWMALEQVHPSKTKLLSATLKVVRTKGYAATRIEDVCSEAAVTKGSFFHHFKGKDELTEAAVAHWAMHVADFFKNAPYHGDSDPLERLLAYVDFRKAILTGDLSDFTCFAGTLVQEVYRTRAAIGRAAGRTIFNHASTLEADISQAMKKYPPRENWTARGLALYMQAVIQGALILAKAEGGTSVALECLDHLKRHLDCTFSRVSAPNA